MSVSRIAALALTGASALVIATSGYTQEQSVEVVTPGLHDAATIYGARAYEAVKLDYASLNPSRGLAVLLGFFASAIEAHDYALLELLVADQIFWEADHGGAWTESNTGYQNLLWALRIDPDKTAPEYIEDSWNDVERSFAHPLLQYHSERDGVICTRPEPRFSNPELAFEVFEGMQSDYFVDWVYVLRPAPVFRDADIHSPMITTVETEALLLVSWEGWSDDSTQPEWVRVNLPSGLKGYIPSGSVYSWTEERLCFGLTPSKDERDKWEIVGYFGGGL